ncbi:LysR family transcriptional regulator [Burkholderia cepacia]|uniref:LysR substrate-binding domain-containing protein n=1 Tax=Burkholderia cepacia TaxID=292 RepID=UPI00249F6247|nr:LysR substrate-binding domain-containing protein [Burkholderia cepacia]WGY71346.1 LysR family transcriptional regulator [Burkholderia cepacia]
MKPQQLKTFVAIAEHGSVRSAARALFVSQPAVTRTLRELEHDLGIPLVRRSVAGVELTDAGRVFQVRAQLLLEEMRRAREEMTYMKVGGHGHVAVAITSTVGVSILPSALEQFMARMPQARLSVTEDAGTVALTKLQNGTLDFVVTHTIPSDTSDEFQRQPLFLMQLVAAARPAHPLSTATSLKQLQDQTWSVPSLAGGYFRRIFEAEGFDVPTKVIECESFAVAAHLLRKIDILGLFSTTLFEHELAPRGACALPLQKKLPPIEVCIVTRRNSYLTPTAEYFKECLQTSPFPEGIIPLPE